MCAVIYARYSTDRQRETSIEDQIRVCEVRAASLGLTVAATYRDDAVSGSVPLTSRPGASALLAARFDVLLLESLDRLSRDMIEQETTVRRLEYRGVRLIGVSDGYDSESAARKLQRGMRGIISEVYLDDLRYRTHRGLAGQVSRGLFAGGLPYGYRSIPAPGGHTLEVREDQAPIVRRIFAEFAAGASVEAIAYQLNAERVPSPRGSTWAVSALYGSPAKGCGILNNELYRGRYIWNRSKWVKDPDTGKRKRLERPAAEWREQDHPELRIVDDGTWRAVRARLAEAGKGRKGKQPSTLFGGLLRCASCGGAVVAINRHTYGCAARKDRGPSVCAGVYAPREKVDQRLIGEARSVVLAPAAIADLAARVAKVLGAHAAEQRRPTRKADLERQIERVVDAITASGGSEALLAKLQALEAEAATVKESLTVPSVASRQQIVKACREVAMSLAAALNSDVPKARHALAQLFGPLVLGRDGKRIVIEYDQPTEALLAAVGSSPEVVAGARYVIRRRIEF